MSYFADLFVACFLFFLAFVFLQQDITSGAQIRSIFNELLDEFVEKEVTVDMTDYDIDLAIRMHEGDSLPGFPSPDTFEYLILPHLRKIQSPVFDCLGEGIFTSHSVLKLLLSLGSTRNYLFLADLKTLVPRLDRVSQSLELLSQKIANRVFGRFPQLSEQVGGRLLWFKSKF